MPKLLELARVVRSKNAKPFVLTLDILFESDEKYRRVAESGAINVEDLARRYRVEPEHVRVIPYPAARAMKITLKRWVPAGTFADTDLLGAQQAIPLFDIDVP